MTEPRSNGSALAGKVAIITGSGRNTGRAIAIEMARQGADIGVHAGSRRHEADETVGEIERIGRRAIACVVDVRDRAGVEDMVTAVVESLGRVDILVNTVAARSHAPLVEVTEEQWQTALGVTLTGAFHCCQAVVPYMIRQGGGSIVNISASPVHNGGKDLVAIAASKAGLHGLTKALAAELGPYGIRVNVIAPHAIDTVERATPISADMRDRLLAEIPLNRLATVQDAANVCAFLAADASSYLTGQSIHLSGGRTMGA